MCNIITWTTVVLVYGPAALCADLSIRKLGTSFRRLNKHILPPFGYLDSFWITRSQRSWRREKAYTETLKTYTCCRLPETRKEHIEHGKLHRNFPFVSPLQTVRTPDTEQPVSHYRTCIYTNAGWLPLRQIVHCRSVEPHPANRIWIWNRENHRHNPHKSLAAYHTVNHRWLREKDYNMTDDLGVTTHRALIDETLTYSLFELS